MPLPLVALAAAAVELSTTAPPVPPLPEPPAQPGPNAPNAPNAPIAPPASPTSPTSPLGPASAAPARLQAAPAAAAPTIDGAVDEVAWRAAPVFRAFVQSYPRYGQPPSERTEARVLYDARNLYVSVIAYQAPSSILAPLSSRDRLPASDLVSIGIDADRDGKTARVFAVNAAGVQLDSLLYDDSKIATGWDAVWEARTRRRADGWSAELRIPLHLLRIPEAAASGEVPALGFIVRRLVGATREEIDSAALPHDQGTIVSRYGELAGMGARATSGVELSPYLASIAGREQGQAAASFDVGLDLRWQSARGPSLAAALNPDFSQVEADEQVANFGNQELERAEKRLFFTDGLNLFAPTDAGDLIAGHNLFYSRRIGLDTPILGAAKLTGAAGPLELGAFTALVSPSRVLTAERGEPSVLEDDEPGATTASPPPPCAPACRRAPPCAATRWPCSRSPPPCSAPTTTATSAAARARSPPPPAGTCAAPAASGASSVSSTARSSPAASAAAASCATAPTSRRATPASAATCAWASSTARRGASACATASPRATSTSTPGASWPSRTSTSTSSR